MLKGKIKFFNQKSKFGFIRDEDGREYYVHAKNIHDMEPKEGDEVEFEVKLAKRGPEAYKVKKENKE